MSLTDLPMRHLQVLIYLPANKETDAMKFRVSLNGQLTSLNGADGDAARTALARTMEELSAQRPSSSAIDLTVSTGEICITCVVEADDSNKAIGAASDVIQLALHTGEIGTPDWPGATDPHWRVEFVGSRAELVAA